MGMIVDASGGQWFAALERTGRIYRLIDMALEDQRMERRIWAIIQLGESGDPRAVRPLMDCCAEEDPVIRNSAINALGKIGSGRAIDLLVERLDDVKEETRIRINAASALAAIRSERARDELRSRCSREGEDPLLQHAIADVVYRSGWK
jgi:hypothetical protein